MRSDGLLSVKALNAMIECITKAPDPLALLDLDKVRGDIIKAFAIPAYMLATKHKEAPMKPLDPAIAVLVGHLATARDNIAYNEGELEDHKRLVKQHRERIAHHTKQAASFKRALKKLGWKEPKK